MSVNKAVSHWEFEVRAITYRIDKNDLNSVLNRLRLLFTMITENENQDDAPKKALIYICGGMYLLMLLSIHFVFTVA